MYTSKNLLQWALAALSASSVCPGNFALATRGSKSAVAVYGVDYTTTLFGLDIIPLRNGDIITSNLTNEQLLESYQAQCDAVNSPMGQSLALMDIANMVNGILVLKQTFANVSVQMNAIDNLGLTSQKFSPSWTNLSQMWDQLVLDSANTANATATYCTNFVVNVMPSVVKLPVANATMLLNGFISDAQSLKDNARATSDNIMSFQQSLATFTFSFQQFAAAQKTVLDGKIDTLEADIKAANATVQMADMQIAAIGAELGSIVLQSIASAQMHPFWAPFILGEASIEVAIKSIPLGGLQSTEQAGLAKIASDQTQIDSLESKDALIAQANETVTDMAELTVSSTSLMGGINSIWSTAVTEAGKVIDFLNMAGNFTAEPQIFWGEVNKVPCYYEALSTQMLQYVADIMASF